MSFLIAFAQNLIKQILPFSATKLYKSYLTRVGRRKEGICVHIRVSDFFYYTTFSSLKSNYILTKLVENRSNNSLK